jgi:uncharacterized protein YhaN
MQEPFDSGESHSESGLESAEYRERLRNKLNCLIAVLEVATAKVRRSLEHKDADVERLGRIQQNLSETLAVCRRAKSALEKRDALPEGLPAQLAAAEALAAPGTEPVLRARRGRMVEMSSNLEFERFRRRAPITRADLSAVDWNKLSAELLG